MNRCDRSQTYTWPDLPHGWCPGMLGHVFPDVATLRPSRWHFEHGRRAYCRVVATSLPPRWHFESNLILAIPVPPLSLRVV